VLDSRGRPTIEAEIRVAGGAIGRAVVPSGASTGRHEAHELRDDDASVYEGRGVLRAVAHINGEIASALRGMDAREQSAIDSRLREIDGTPDLRRLGANAILGASLAACRAAAAQEGRPVYRRIAELCGVAAPILPLPMVNILSGGAHARRGMDLQDFLVIPLAATTYAEALEMVVAVRAAADVVATRRGLTSLLADEGGLSPGFPTSDQALDLMIEVIEQAGFRPGDDVAIALDCAASELCAQAGLYRFSREGVERTTDEMIEMVGRLVARYPILSIEDPLDQEDWEGWRRLTARFGRRQIVGDDLFTTDPGRIAHGIELGTANSVLIKVNQIGTLSGALAALRLARDAGYGLVVSARSGETEDPFIADLAVGTASGQIKIGSVRSSERLSKYNQLLRIEEEVGHYAGASALMVHTRASATA